MMLKKWFTAQVLSYFFKPDATVSSEKHPIAEWVEQSNQDDLSLSLLHETFQAEKSRALEMAEIANQTGINVRELSTAITEACRETDPKFLQLGRDLQEIYTSAMELTSAIQTTASHLSLCEGGESCLDQTRFLIDNAWQSLNGGQKNIENSLGHVRDLIDHLEKFTSICEMITRIGLWFRVVGVNIEVECSIQGLSGDMFSGVSQEVSALSKKINQRVGDIRNDLTTAGNHLAALEHASSTSLVQIGGMAEKAEGIVRKSYEDIRQLMDETSTLIDTARAKSQIIGEKVGDVVVGIQFHDSMSQRIEHVIEALQDIDTLCMQSGKTEAAETLGSACLILDFQKRQLLNLTEEIRALALTTQGSFQVISGEVAEMSTKLADSRLTDGRQKQAGANFIQPLQKGLRTLGGLLGTGNDMIEALHHSAGETALVSDHLLEMIIGVKKIREETHIMAINTIIMACQLGDKGRTIEVLAKEIRALADQTGEMVDGVTVIQSDIVSEVTALRDSIALEGTTISSVDLEHGLATIGDSYQQVQMGIGTVAKNAALLANRITAVAAQLSFLEDLGARMELSAQKVDQIQEALEPWRNSGQIHDENIQRLLTRYTMDQERLAHSQDKNQGANDAGEDDGDIFFFDECDSQNIEMFADAAEDKKRDSTSLGDNVELF